MRIQINAINHPDGTETNVDHVLAQNESMEGTLDFLAGDKGWTSAVLVALSQGEPPLATVDQ